MTSQRLILPNDVNGFVIEEMMDRLASGITVTIAFGGNSMQPLINGSSDRIELAPLSGELRRGDVYLFVHQGRCVIHRLLKIKGDKLVFRGDNCRNCEVVGRDAVRARLVAVCHADGSRTVCDTAEWRRCSRRVVWRRSLLNAPYVLLGRRQRRWQRWVYLALLLVLMWTPVGGLGLRLDSFVFGLRLDHLLHASVYIPFVFFVMDFGKGRSRWLVFHWLAGLLFAAVTESGQLALFYRGFDPNDLVANCIGVTFGWFLLLVMKHNRR